MRGNVNGATLQVSKKTRKRLVEQSARLERIEAIGRKQRRDSADVLVMMRAIAGDFDERVR